MVRGVRLLIVVAVSLLALAGRALAADPVVIAAGDLACSTSDPNYNSGLGQLSAVFPKDNCVQKTVSDTVLAANPTAFLTLGDNENGPAPNYSDTTSLADFQNVYAPSFGRLNAVVYPEVGNADYSGSPLSNSGFMQYFTNAGVIARIQSDGGNNANLSNMYYSFNLGSWHIIALNSECSALKGPKPGDGGCGVGSLEDKWLQADLKAHPGVCTLAYWHVPLWNSSSQGTGSSGLQFWKDLYAAHADVILNAHGNNHYEDFVPLSPTGTAPYGTADTSGNGIREFIVSNGGYSHGSPNAAGPTTSAINFTNMGALELTLHPTSYSWQFLAAAGGTFTDSGSAKCHETTTPPPNPTVTSVTPTAGQTGVYPNKSVYEVFSAPMNEAATQAAFSLAPTAGGAPVAGSFSWYGPTVMIFTPNTDLQTGVQYTANISTAAKDQNGTPLASAKTWQFTTINQPVIDRISPAAGASGVGTSSPAYAIFSEAMNHTTTAAAFSLARSSDGSPVPGTVSFYGDTVPIFTPSSPLAVNTTYTATISGSATDQAGHSLANPTSWQFTTGTSAQAQIARFGSPAPLAGARIPAPLSARVTRLQRRLRTLVSRR